MSGLLYERDLGIGCKHVTEATINVCCNSVLFVNGQQLPLRGWACWGCTTLCQHKTFNLKTKLQQISLKFSTQQPQRGQGSHCKEYSMHVQCMHPNPSTYIATSTDYSA